MKRLSGWLLAASSLACVSAAAQVVGLQPIPIAQYYFDPGSGQYKPCPNDSTTDPGPVPPLKEVLAGYNSSLDAWTPETSCGGNNGNSSFAALTSGTNTQATMFVGSGGYLSPSGSGIIIATNLGSGATGSVPYQTGPGATAFVPSPSTTGHTFFLGWTPSGGTQAPTALDLGTYLTSHLASPPAIGGTTPNTGSFSTLSLPSLTSLTCLGTDSSGQVIAGTCTGSVNSGTIGQVGYYASTGSVISGTTALPNGITAVTQSLGDGTTAVATDAFVLANAGSGGPSGNSYALPFFPSSTGTLTQSNLTLDPTGSILYVPLNVVAPTFTDVNTFHIDAYAAWTGTNTNAPWNSTVSYTGGPTFPGSATGTCELVSTSTAASFAFTGAITQPTTYTGPTGQPVVLPSDEGILTITAVSAGTGQFGRSFYTTGAPTTLAGSQAYQISGTTNGVGQYLLYNVTGPVASTTFTSQDNVLWVSAKPSLNHPPAISGDDTWIQFSYITQMSSNLVVNWTDCGVAQAKRPMQLNNVGTMLKFGSYSQNRYVKGLPWELGLTNFGSRATLSIDGQGYTDPHNAGGATVSQISGSTIMEPVIAHYPDAFHDFGASLLIKSLNLRNFTTANHADAKGLIEADGEEDGIIQFISGRDMTVGHAMYDWGSNGIQGGNDQQMYIQDIYGTSVVGAVSTWTRPGVTVALTSGAVPPGTSAFTIVTGGGSIPSNAVAKWTGYGSHNYLPCATMPDPPAIGLTAGVLTSLTQDSNGGVNCDGNLQLQVWPLATATEGMIAGSMSDSTVMISAMAGTFSDAVYANPHGGGNIYYFGHPVGGNGTVAPCGMRDGWGGIKMIHWDFDTTDWYGLCEDDAFGQHTGSTVADSNQYFNIQSRPQKGAGGFLVSNTLLTPLIVSNFNCGGTTGWQNQGGYFKAVTQTGLVGYPNNLIQSSWFQSCDGTFTNDNNMIGNNELTTPWQSTPQAITAATTLPAITGASVELSGSAAISTIPAPAYLYAQNTAEVTVHVAAGSTWTLVTGGNLSISSTITPAVGSSLSLHYWPASSTWSVSGAASGGTGFPFVLGTTSIAASSTTTSVAGLAVNGVTLNSAGSTTLFLNQSGTYTAPSGTGNTTSSLTSGFLPIANGTNSIVNSLCDEGHTTANVFTCTDSAGASFLGLKTTGSGGGSWTFLEGTAPTGLPNNDIIFGDSSTHRPMMNPNNTGATFLIGLTSVATPGQFLLVAANGHDATGTTVNLPQYVYTNVGNGATGIGPVTFTPSASDTLTVWDATATPNGNTRFHVIGGFGQSSDLVTVDDANGLLALHVTSAKQVQFGKTISIYNSNSTLDQGLAPILGSTDTTYEGRTANLTTATFYTTPNDGISPQFWNVSCNAETTTAGSGTLLVTLNYVDQSGNALTWPMFTTGLALGTSHAVAAGAWPLVMQANGAVTLTTSGYTSGTYNLHCWAEDVR